MQENSGEGGSVTQSWRQKLVPALPEGVRRGWVKKSGPRRRVPSGRGIRPAASLMGPHRQSPRGVSTLTSESQRQKLGCPRMLPSRGQAAWDAVKDPRPKCPLESHLLAQQRQEAGLTALGP